MECDSDEQLLKNPRRIMIPFIACLVRLRIPAMLAIAPTASIIGLTASREVRGLSY
jgi:hypothetical protein